MKMDRGIGQGELRVSKVIPLYPDLYTLLFISQLEGVFLQYQIDMRSQILEAEEEKRLEQDKEKRQKVIYDEFKLNLQIKMRTYLKEKKTQWQKEKVDA